MNCKAVLFRVKKEEPKGDYVPEFDLMPVKYVQEEVQITNVFDMLKLLGDISADDSMSIHLKDFGEENKGVSVYASKVFDESLDGMLANVYDRNNNFFCWNSNFLVCGETRDSLRDIEDEDLKFALESIDSAYISE